MKATVFTRPLHKDKKSYVLERGDSSEKLPAGWVMSSRDSAFVSGHSCGGVGLLVIYSPLGHTYSCTE